MPAIVDAPGRPGIIPRWTSSSKIGVGTALTSDCNLWFTLSHGIINEVYYPRIDIANVRDIEFIVTHGDNFFSEEKRDCDHFYSTLAPGIPAYRIINKCQRGRYIIEKIIIADSRRNCLLQRVTFTPLQGSLEDYRIYLLLAPHVENAGFGNHGWTGDYKGIPMLFANKTWVTLACASSQPFEKMTCGYVGFSDAWQDLHAHKRLTQTYHRVMDGNVALCGEINLKACGGAFTVAAGFGVKADDAGIQTRGALARDFQVALDEYMRDWKAFQDTLTDLCKFDIEGSRLYHISASVLKIHEGKHFSGSVIASLSIPWGFSKGDNDLGGYHLIWPRDQVQSAQALLAAGNPESARQALMFLICTQECDGHWMQCLWEDGSPYWDGLQMDETAAPILLADLLRRTDHLQGMDPWSMVEKAASFIVQKGPTTKQDRWEENGGYTPYTIAAQIAALLCAADFFDLKGKKEEAGYLRELADWWNDSIERWLYVTNTALSNRLHVDGYYVRVAPEGYEKDEPWSQTIIIKNRPCDLSHFPYTAIVSVDALALVRFGLRKADDPRILNTVKVIDALLKTETAKGPAWHRYNEDGYGEHKDGRPYDGTGTGRAWPLLSGERAHYELAAGNRDEALNLLRTFASMAGEGGLIPEQIWDAADKPERKLYNGHSTGSAKPLVWAHAEYIVLLRSLRDGKIFTMPPQTYKRYVEDSTRAKVAFWHLNADFNSIPEGMGLRMQFGESARIRWTIDNWAGFHDTETKGNDLGIYYADFPSQGVKGGTKLEFTMFYPDREEWEGKNYCISII